MLSSSGDFESASKRAPVGNPRNEGWAKIKTITVTNRIAIDQRTRSWLEKNVSKLDIEEKYFL